MKKFERGARSVLFAGTAIGALIIAGAASTAFAQDKTSAKKDDSTVVVVTGVRASLQSAMKKKKDSDQIQESVTAEDIGKMPDNNLAETLQRLTGVQMNRDLGEGKYISIRGLTQVQSELNGRPIFSADGDGRTLNYEAVPAELLAGADVYKSPMADQIDGGIGGLVDFRTRRPFDFKGFKFAGSVRGDYGDQVKLPTYSESFLISDRWDTSIGEMGALLSVSDGHRKFQRDFTKNADWKAHELTDANGNNLYPGKTCSIPGSAAGTVCIPEAEYSQPDEGSRDRLGVNASFQWKPNAQTQVYVDATEAKFNSTEKVLGSFPCPVCTTSTPIASNVVFDSSRPADVRSATYSNVLLINDNYYGKNNDTDNQVAAGVKWTGDTWNFLAEATTAKTKHTGYFMLLEQQATAPTMNFDTRTSPTTYAYPGFDLTNAANWHYSSVTYSPSEADGRQNAVKWDAEYKPSSGWLKSVKFGMRYGDEFHSADSVSDGQSASGTLGSNSIPVAVSSHTDILSTIPTAWITPKIDTLANPSYVMAVFGYALPTGWDPHNHFDIDEKTMATYVMAKFQGSLGVPYSGNVGVRYVSTNDSDNGWLVNNGVYSPFHLSHKYSDVLPSMNVAFDLTSDLKLRLAASKVLTRPDFPDLNPTVQLQPFFHTASGGNPDLKPLRADQLDSSLEYYFSSTGYLYGAAFYKKVENFIFTSDANELYNNDPTPYLTSHPSNGTDGKIKGLELGYQDFFTSLPAPFDGVGVIANATYIDSSTPSPVQVGALSPLPQLSRYSYNLIGMYEKGPISFRLAYNWRDHFVETYTGANGGIQAEIRKAYGILDLSGSYKLNNNWSITFDGQNLTQPLRQTYYTVQSHPAEFQTEDRYYSLGVRFSY